MKVYKYSLGEPGPYHYEQGIRLPTGAKPLSVGMQGNELVLWAAVDPDDQFAWPEVFVIVGTGVPYSQPGWEFQFVGTAHQEQYVWHVFHKVADVMLDTQAG